MRLLGHLPSLDTCVECGAAVELTGRVPFGQLVGGVLCRECRAGQKQVVSVSAGVLRAMAQFADADAQSWRRIQIEPRTRGELRAVLNHYWRIYWGIEPRMHRTWERSPTEQVEDVDLGFEFYRLDRDVLDAADYSGSARRQLLATCLLVLGNWLRTISRNGRARP